MKTDSLFVLFFLMSIIFFGVAISNITTVYQAIPSVISHNVVDHFYESTVKDLQSLMLWALLATSGGILCVISVFVVGLSNKESEESTVYAIRVMEPEEKEEDN